MTHWPSQAIVIMYGRSTAEVGCFLPTGVDINRLLWNHDTMHSVIMDYILLKIAGLDNEPKKKYTLIILSSVNRLKRHLNNIKFCEQIQEQRTFSKWSQEAKETQHTYKYSSSLQMSTCHENIKTRIHLLHKERKIQWKKKYSEVNCQHSCNSDINYNYVYSPDCLLANTFATSIVHCCKMFKPYPSDL